MLYSAFYIIWLLGKNRGQLFFVEPKIDGQKGKGSREGIFTHLHFFLPASEAGFTGFSKP